LGQIFDFGKSVRVIINEWLCKMCLAIPGKVVEIFQEAGMKMGVIDFAGTRNKVCLEFLPEITVGDYTVVHAGFGISVVNPEEARKSYEVWEELIRSTGEGQNDQQELLAAIQKLKMDFD
jgi:hydrogenase expression/formation protein HypC